MFCINTWNNFVFWLSNAVCDFRKWFAKNANRLRFSQTASKSPKNVSVVRWKRKASVQIAYAHRMKLHVVYVEKINTWTWQIGNEFFYERGNALSEEDAKHNAVQVCNAYYRWSIVQTPDLQLMNISWKPMKQDFIGAWREYEFWISPLDDTNRLWRYDIYLVTATKSIRSGVARSLPLAKHACVRAIATIDA